MSVSELSSSLGINFPSVQDCGVGDAVGITVGDAVGEDDSVGAAVGTFVGLGVTILVSTWEIAPTAKSTKTFSAYTSVLANKSPLEDASFTAAADAIAASSSANAMAKSMNTTTSSNRLRASNGIICKKWTDPRGTIAAVAEARRRVCDDIPSDTAPWSTLAVLAKSFLTAL